MHQQATQADPTDSDQPPPADQPSTSITVELFDALKLLDNHTRTTLADLASRALAQLPNQGQVRVSIVNDERMSSAHEQFSGITGTTDVLTFDLAPQTKSFDQKTLDTDLTICFDEAMRQATKLNHPIEHELLLYIIHGTLHCLGYNDHDDAEYQRMHTKEDQLLAALGIAPTFFKPAFDKENNPTQPENKS